MPNLVVTCHPDGRVETLLKDKVLDTRILGDSRRIERVSEILPTDDGQKFFIRWLRGPLCDDLGQVQLAFNAMNQAYALFSNRSIMCEHDGETCYYDSYEEAVEWEVRYVNVMRVAGYSFT